MADRPSIHSSQVGSVLEIDGPSQKKKTAALTMSVTTVYLYYFMQRWNEGGSGESQNNVRRCWRRQSLESPSPRYTVCKPLADQAAIAHPFFIRIPLTSFGNPAMSSRPANHSYRHGLLQTEWWDDPVSTPKLSADQPSCRNRPRSLEAKSRSAALATVSANHLAVCETQLICTRGPAWRHEDPGDWCTNPASCTPHTASSGLRKLTRPRVGCCIADLCGLLG